MLRHSGVAVPVPVGVATRTRRRRCGGPARGSGGARLGGRRRGRRSRRRADRIDAVNVFPVADSDTGTNVLLTVVGGADAVDARPGGRGGGRDVARAFARGAMRAARGNSGVIVSQYLTGFARALPDAGGTRATSRTRLAVAARAAREATAEPQEGTVLTLADVVAARAATAADAGADLRDDARRRSSRRRCGRSVGSAPSTPCCAPRACSTPAPARCSSSWTRWPGRSATSGRCTSRSTGCPTAAAHPWPVEPTGGAYEVMLLVSDDGASDGAVVDTGAELRRRMGGARRLGGGRRRGRLVARARPHRRADRRDRRGRAWADASRSSSGSSPARTRAGRRCTTGDGRARWGVVVCTAVAGPRRAGTRPPVRSSVVRCPEAPIRVAAPRARGHGHGGGARGPAAGDGCGGRELAPARPGRPVVETLDAGDELRVVVGSLALAGEGRRRRAARRRRRRSARLGRRTPSRPRHVAGRAPTRPTRSCGSAADPGREPDRAGARRTGRGARSTPSSRTWRRTTPASRRRSSDRRGTVPRSCSGWTDRGDEARGMHATTTACTRTSTRSTSACPAKPAER